MTQIDYTYQVIRVDRAHNAMEVKYTSAEHGSATVGMPLPSVGHDLDEFVASYAPVNSWLQKEVVAAQVAVGTVGSLTFVQPVAEPMASIEKLGLANKLRAIPHNDGTLWDAFKAQVALADEETQEDWAMAHTIARTSPLLNAVMVTLLGDQAQATIEEIYT